MLTSRHILAETRALAARFSTPPTAVRMGQLNRLIRDLQLAGLYTNTKIKGLYLLAAADAQAARQNIIENAVNLSVSGSPTFTADRGYTGGASDGLTVSASADATNHSAGFWINNYNADSGYINTGGTNGYLRASSTQMAAKWSAVGEVTENTTGAHSVMATVDAGVNLRFYKNGALVSTESAGGGSISLGTIVIATGYSGRHAAAHWGPNLTTGELAALYAALNTYLTSVGGN
ncbi:MAG: hypothetical protein Q8R82_16045 [Hyphomonadaceae bacterium]|nr:hypothetical protein [Hyphomonadaceae bacterium]